MPPFQAESWPYTGRAFALNPEFFRTEWLKVLREDIESEKNWRIFVKPFIQDGSKGSPMSKFDWDFSSPSTKSLNKPKLDEFGKKNFSIPGGYLADFTAPHLHYEVRLGLNDFFSSVNPELGTVPPDGKGILVGTMTTTLGEKFLGKKLH